MAKDVAYEGEREVKTYFELAHGADVLIEKSEKDKKGSTYTTMGSLLLTAFTFEAYLNHLGAKKVKFWDEIESIRVLDKYSVLCKLFKITPNYSERPYQTIKALFKFRNFMAHGKSVILKETKEISFKGDLYEHRPTAEWEKYCTLENAKRAKEDIDIIITELNKKAGLGDRPFVGGLSFGSAKMKTPGK